MYNQTFQKLPQGDRSFNMTTNTYVVAGNISVQRGCFALMFVNTGTAVCRVNDNIILNPGTPGSVNGDATSIAGHKNDVYMGIIKVTFDAPLGTGPAVQITQLFYSDYQQ